MNTITIVLITTQIVIIGLLAVYSIELDRLSSLQRFQDKTIHDMLERLKDNLNLLRKLKDNNDKTNKD